MAKIKRLKTKIIQKIQNNLSAKSKIKVGLPKSKTDSDILNIAIWNHFGTRGGGWGGPIPERPFLSNAMRDNRTKYRNAMKVSAPKILRGETTSEIVMQKLGLLAVGDVQKEMTNMKTPPNSPVTIKLKGSSNPLIDTGTMRASVTFEVTDV